MTANDVCAIAPERCQLGFVPADVLKSFKADILDELWCRTLVLGRLHRKQPRCPGCSMLLPDKALQRFWQGGRIRCDACGKFFTALTDTFLSGAHLSFQEIVLMGFMMEIGANDKTIADILGISAEAVRIWRNKFVAVGRLQAMRQENAGQVNGELPSSSG